MKTRKYILILNLIENRLRDVSKMLCLSFLRSDKRTRDFYEQPIWISFSPLYPDKNKLSFPLMRSLLFTCCGRPTGTDDIDCYSTNAPIGTDDVDCYSTIALTLQVQE